MVKAQKENLLKSLSIIDPATLGSTRKICFPIVTSVKMLKKWCNMPFCHSIMNVAGFTGPYPKSSQQKSE